MNSDNNVLGTLDQYNVTWTTFGQTDRSSMPIGNGEVGVNLWVQRGEINFYFARTDARTETDRSVKLGKVRLSFPSEMSIFDQPFRQTLVLRDGRIDLDFGTDAFSRAHLEVFVDSEQPVIYVTGQFSTPVTVQVDYINWRTEPFDGDMQFSGVVETADSVQPRDGGILFYHRNGATQIPFITQLEAVTALADSIPDCLTNRTFGGLMVLEGAALNGNAGLISSTPVQTFTLRVITYSDQVANLDDWINAVTALRAALPIPSEARQRTAAWWHNYWQQSWMFVEGDVPVAAGVTPELLSLPLEVQPVPEPCPSQVTQAYILTRWMFACMERGAFPILYSGGSFNVMPGMNEHLGNVYTFSRSFSARPFGEPTPEFNPDERGWGHFYLWQNTRLPYASMLARGEHEPVRALFRFYRRFWELDRGRAQVYYGAQGQYNTEIVHSHGLMPSAVYGLDRSGLADGYAANRWGGAVDLSPGLELLQLMLDYYDYRRDDPFLNDELLPYARDLLLFIETRFPERDKGKIVIRPIQSVETYWDTTNSLPVVAGMHAVVKRILALDPEKVPDRDYFVYMQQMMPYLPMETAAGSRLIAPAEVYDPERHNVEAPQLYAIFPFRLYGLGKPDLPVARESFRHGTSVVGNYQPFVVGKPPTYPSYSGWQYHGLVTALLGLTDETQTILQNNCALSNPGHRFPAMWGPIYDAVPDIDHASNILTTLQLMAFQAEGDEIRLLPAFPEAWDVSFKLHAPRGTTVECVYHKGKITRLIVTPKERRKDVVCAVELPE
ncbi:MAG: DUF5703 domain-containing protein [Anaerolineae bacterium]|nr:DUF5703 domain-containing protein [Anaerolineae bacterium]NUQ05293.1 hypothetical protein [Anaerolineae bacterium]